MKAGVPGRSWIGPLPHTWLRVLLALIVSSATLSSFAQATGAQAAGSSQPNLSAHELARRVDSYYNALHSLRATFTESYEGMGISRKESGTMLLRKPGKMRWNYAEPQGKLFLLEGKYAWFYSPGDAQVQRLAASQLDDLRSPLRFLLGHTQLERELGNLTLASTPAGFELSGSSQRYGKASPERRFGSCRQRRHPVDRHHRNRWRPYCVHVCGSATQRTGIGQ